MKLALLTLLVCAQDHPAPTVQPKVPTIEPQEAPAPVGAALKRDGFIADRFTAKDMRVAYTFEAHAGELSLFHVGSWGFARGWTSTIGLRVLDAQGKVLLERERPGGAVHHLFEAFEAPAAGGYTFELSSPENGYRYTLVRHSHYTPWGEDEVRALEGELLHGHLATAASRAGYALDLEADQAVVLRAELTHPQGENQARNLRGRQALRVALGEPIEDAGAARRGMSEAEMRTLRQGGAASFPALALTVLDPDGNVLTAGRHATLLRAPRAGRYAVVVHATSRGEGGLFRLHAERNPELVTVSGYVADKDDDPIAGIRVDLLREPGFEALGSAVSSEDGEWTLAVPPGSYTVLLSRPGSERPAVERVQTRFDEDRAWNGIWPH